MQVDGREQAQQPGDNHHGAKPEQTGGSSLQDAGYHLTATMNSGGTEAMQASTRPVYMADLPVHFPEDSVDIQESQGFDIGTIR